MRYVISNSSEQERYDQLKEWRRRKRLIVADGDCVDMHDDTDYTDVADGDSSDHTGCCLPGKYRSFGSCLSGKWIIELKLDYEGLEEKLESYERVLTEESFKLTSISLNFIHVHS